MDEYERGAQAMFDALTMRAANHYHGNPIFNEQCNKDNQLIWEWSMDALESVAPNRYEEMCKFYKINE